MGNVATVKMLMLPQEALRYSTDVVHIPDPLAKLQSIWHCGAEENDTDVIGKHNQNLLPHNSSLRKNKAIVREVLLTLYSQLDESEI